MADYDFSKYPEGLKEPNHAYVDLLGVKKRSVSGGQGNVEDVMTLVRLNVDTIWGNLDSVLAYVAKGWSIKGYGKLNPKSDEHMKIKAMADQISGAIKSAVTEALAMECKVMEAKNANAAK